MMQAWDWHWALLLLLLLFHQVHLSDCLSDRKHGAGKLTGPTVQGSDRWQPPDVHNTGEILVRPEPVGEEAEQDQQASERALNHSDAIPASAAADDVVPKSAAAVDDTEVQRDVVAQDETRKEQHRHRQRSDTVPVPSVPAVCLSVWCLVYMLSCMYGLIGGIPMAASF